MKIVLDLHVSKKNQNVSLRVKNEFALHDNKYTYDMLHHWYKLSRNAIIVASNLCFLHNQPVHFSRPSQTETLKMSKPYVERSRTDRPVGKFIYHDDLRKFHGKKHAEELKKKEQETKRFKKAAMLRKYAKLCKAEGIKSDRVRMGDKDKSDEPSERPPKKSKLDQHRPFKRAEVQAARTEQAEKEKEELVQERLKQKEDAIRKREQKHRALSQTTKKGQPRLGNHMKALLEKLQKA